MISILRGKLIEARSDEVVVECGGLGYLIKVPASVAPSLPEPGNDVFLYTSMILSKTDISLVGFTEETQRTCFHLLMSVSGCGVKNSLALLSHLTPGQIYRAITDNNDTVISKVKGVGKKLSQRIVLELQSKMKAFATESLPSDHVSISNTAQIAVEALVSLGFKKKDAESAVNGMDASLSVEDVISRALKKLV